MRHLSRRRVEGPGRSPAARRVAAAVCRASALRYAVRLERGEGGAADEGGRDQSVGRRHHRDFGLRRLTAASLMTDRLALGASIDDLLDRLYARNAAQDDMLAAYFTARAEEGSMDWNNFDQRTTEFLKDKLV